MTRTFCYLFLAVLSAWMLVGCGGSAQTTDVRGPQPLLLQPAAGDVFRTETTIDQTMQMTVMEQTVDIIQTVKETVEWRVDTVRADGTFRAQVITTRYRLKQEGPGLFEDFDTEDPTSTPQSDLSVGMAALTDVPLTVNVTPLGDVSVTAGMDALYNNIVDLSLNNANGAETLSRAQRDTLRSRVRSALSAEDLAREMGAVFYMHTRNAVAPGSTWAVKTPVASDLPIEFDASVRFDSMTTRQMFLTARGDVRNIPPDRAGAMLDNSFQDLRLSGTQTATFTLHRPTGVPLATMSRRRLDGTAVIQAAGGDLDVSISIRTTTDIKTTVPAPPDTDRPPQ